MKSAARQSFALETYKTLVPTIYDMLGIEPPADRVVQLLGVHAEVDPAHPGSVGAHRRGEGL